MIYESCYWKQPLLRSATWLENITIQESKSEGTLARIERAVLIGFYSVRRLLETFEVTKATKSMQFTVVWYKNIKRVDYMNNHQINDCFDVNNGNHEDLGIFELCNQFIHSYVFTITSDDDGHFTGCLVSSDRKRYRKLYYIDRETITKVFRSVGRDYPNTMTITRNSSTGQWEEN